VQHWTLVKTVGAHWTEIPEAPKFGTEQEAQAWAEQWMSINKPKAGLEGVGLLRVIAAMGVNNAQGS
jgi:hypothetical protein